MNAAIRRIAAGLPALALALAAVSHAAADEATGGAMEPEDPVEIVLAADLVDFGYREFDAGGRELNREDGLLPGLRLTARTTRDHLLARIDASFHGGTVDYDGETQADPPVRVRSDTDTRLWSIGADLGAWVGPEPGRLGLFAHFARRFWGRDIRSRGNVQGIYEEYRWTELGGGIRHVWTDAGDDTWGHELSVLAYAVTAGDIFVELSGLEGVDWDDETLELGDESGLRLRYTATRRLAGDRLLRIEPYFAYWEFGRSNSATVTSDGAPADCDPDQAGFQGCTVHEPRSESRRLGVTIGLVF